MALYYERIGEKTQPVILMLHGIGTSGWMFWQQRDRFKNYQIIVVDLPGHGKSVNIPWESLKETARLIVEDVLEGQPAHIVGISLGGHVALEMAKWYSHHTLSTFISGITVNPMPFKFLLGIQARLYQRMIHDENQIRKLAQEDYHLPSEKFPVFKDTLQLLTREIYESIGREIMSFKLDKTYAAIEVPCLFVAGTRESKGILESVHLAPKIISSAKGKLIKGAEHAWIVQQPEKFNNELRHWLDKVSIGIHTK